MKKIVVVTGASKGIGLAIANIFAQQEDYKVITCARHKLTDESMHPAIDFFECDMNDKQQIVLFAEYIKTTYGEVSVLVNNAGVFVPGRIQDETDDVFETLLRVNLSSAYYMTKHFLSGMIKNQEGTIFNICSTASIASYANGGSYAISKHALLGFSRCLREETKEQGIRVIAVLPGATYTDSWIGSGIAEDRMIPVTDIASIVFDTYKLSKRTVIEELIVRPILGDIK